MTGVTKTEQEQALMERARAVLPAGGFGNFAPDIVVARGHGGRVWDVSGNEYVDYLLGSGPMMVGHAHPEVIEAVTAQLPFGSTFFADSEPGIRLAEEIVDAVACAEKVRFVSSGSEADMYAMRLARAHSGKDKILKFEGGYHGMSDFSLMSLAPKHLANFPQPVPDSAGIPKGVRDDVIVAPFNDTDLAVRMIAEYAGELGGVIVEPFQRLIPPKPGFLEALREATSKHGVPLIFDEVVTGFRFAYGGAQAYYGITPDLCTLGKVIGGGYPLAAIAGSDEIMAHFDKARVGDAGFTYQVGTLSGNPVASVAGLKTMEILKRDGAYDRIFATGRTIMAALEEHLGRAGVAAQVVGEPPLFDVVFTDHAVRDYRGVFAGDAVLLKRFNALLRERGILKPDSKYYIGLCHNDADVAMTVDAIASAADALKAAA
jgi:glutamate-1-semialdehyde 2,1-aminomutase